jgi:hypothetical protein
VLGGCDVPRSGVGGGNGCQVEATACAAMTCAEVASGGSSLETTSCQF